MANTDYIVIANMGGVGSVTTYNVFESVIDTRTTTTFELETGNTEATTQRVMFAVYGDQ